MVGIWNRSVPIVTIEKTPSPAFDFHFTGPLVVLLPSLQLFEQAYPIVPASRCTSINDLVITQREHIAKQTTVILQLFIDRFSLSFPFNFMNCQTNHSVLFKTTSSSPMLMRLLIATASNWERKGYLFFTPTPGGYVCCLMIYFDVPVALV